MISKELYSMLSKKGFSSQLPTTEIALRWLRELYEVNVAVLMDEHKYLSDDPHYYNSVTYFYLIQKPYMNTIKGDTHYVSYDEALNEGIKRALTKI